MPFYLLGLGSYLGNTVIMNLFLYLGIWRFYKMLIQLYPKNVKWLARAVFFIPSVVFWSSGILKDGWTAVTEDGSLSAHFEHSIAIRNGEPEILSYRKKYANA